MQRTAVLNQVVPPAQAATASQDAEPALRVVVVYQDSLTWQWTTDLWERVGQLIGDESVRHKAWKMSDLTNPGVFTDAVRAAGEADVLVVSVRDTGELPMSLYLWIDAWMPSRVGPAGALVGLIGVPPEPDAQSGHAYRYLETVARKAGLDYLPREHKLPEERLAPRSPAKIGQAVSRTPPLGAGAFSSGEGSRLHWGLNE